MGFFDLFSRKTYEDYENAGDAFFSNKVFGAAKLEFEKSLNKLQKSSVQNESAVTRIQDKIAKTKESLAHQHKKSAEDLLAGGMVDDAEDLFRLALELTADQQLAAAIEKQLTEIDNQYVGPQRKTLTDIIQEDLPEDTPEDEEYFELLLNVLPEEEQHIYRQLSDDFKQGYIALNQGDFDTALRHFGQAVEDSDHPEYVQLEMATAYLHQGRLPEARDVLEAIIQAHPGMLRAYHVLCEIHWGEEGYDQALQLIDTAPESLQEVLPLHLLKGETLYRARRFEEARDFYDHCRQSFEWDEMLARGRAKTFMALGLFKEACDTYGQIMGACQGCGQRLDPVVKRGYADASLALGENTSSILEMYFELTREDPTHQTDYFQKISQIYEKQGKAEEAKRYRAIAKQG